MTYSDILTIVSICVGAIIATVGAVWTVFQAAARQKEKHEDERHKVMEDSQTTSEEKTAEMKKVIWHRLDTLRDEVAELKVKDAELAGKLAAIPTSESIDKSLQQLEARIEKSLTRQTDTILKLIAKP